jgi:ubiquitin carboxyl-terminal hydrolase L5
MGGKCFIRSLFRTALIHKYVQFENSLRRHNHVGLVHALLATLAKAGKLNEAKEGAKSIMQERKAKAKEKGEDMEED